MVLLREMPPFSDYLVCGVSSQLHQFVDGFDDIVTPDDADFISSGLVSESVVRLGYLGLLTSDSVPGSIGAISPERHKRLLRNLSNYLVQRIQ